MKKTIKLSLLLAVLFITAFSSHLKAQTADAEIQVLTRQFQDAYNKEDAKAIKAMYTADAVRVEVDGKTTNGAEGVKAIYETQFKNGDATVLINSVNVVSQNNTNATATGTFHVNGKTVKGDKIDLTGAYTNTLVKQNGQWKISKTVLNNLVKTIVTHKVADWAKWKEGFDSFKQQRLDGGELSYEVGTLNDDPGTVYVINEWVSVDKAKAFFANPALAEAMKKFGVIEAPHFMYLDKK